MKLSRQAKAVISEMNTQVASIKDVKRGSIDPQINIGIESLVSHDFISGDKSPYSGVITEIFKAWYFLKRERNQGRAKLEYTQEELGLSDLSVTYLYKYCKEDYEAWSVELDSLVYRYVGFCKDNEFDKKGYKGHVLKLVNKAWNVYKVHDFAKEVGIEYLMDCIKILSNKNVPIQAYPMQAIWNKMPLDNVEFLIQIEYIGRSFKRQPMLSFSKDQLRKLAIVQGAFKARAKNKNLQSNLGMYMTKTNFCKGLSITEFKYMVEGIKFWTNARMGLHIAYVAPAVFVTLGKLKSNELRYAAIHGSFTYEPINRENSGRFIYTVTKRSINWACVKEVQDLMLAGKHRMVLNHESQPKARKFFKEHGVYVKSSDIPANINIKALNLMKKVNLHNSDGNISEADMLIDCIKIANIFGMKSVEILTRTNGNSYLNPHTFVNMTGVKEIQHPLNLQWNQFFFNNESYAKYAGYVTEDMEVPKSVEQFKQFVRAQRYSNVPKGFENIVDLAARHELTNYQFNDLVVAIQKLVNKKSEMLPFVRIDGSTIEGVGHQYVLEKLDADDPSALLIGLDTSCCQYIGGVGRSCAIHSYEEASSAIYVVRKNGKVVAQSWAWRNVNNGVILDSIEFNISERNHTDPVALLFKELTKELLGKLMIDSVYIGVTSYGMTSVVLEKTGKIHTSIHETKMISSCSYMDGKYHYLVSATEEHINRYLKFSDESSILAVCA